MKMRVKMWSVRHKKMFTCEEMAKDQFTLLTTGEFINVATSVEHSTIYDADYYIPLHSTLLHVSNGELFEGDVITLKTNYGYVSAFDEEEKIGTVVWKEDWAGFAIEHRLSPDSPASSHSSINEFDLGEIVIIGNKYEGRFE